VAKLSQNLPQTVTVQSLVSITRFVLVGGESRGVERSEAEAIFDAGREVCVGFILDLARRFEELTAASARLEERVRRLEEQTRKDSRNSSQPPSADPPKTRQQRRAEARAKAKELATGDRAAGGQPGHRGCGRKLVGEDQVDEIVPHYPESCGAAGTRSTITSGCRAGASGATR